MSKRTRQQAILDVVSSKRVPSQATLADELKDLGFDVTQATLSRDIAELNLVKTKDGYARPEDAGGGGPAVPDPVGMLRRLVVKVEDAGNLVVVKTQMGSAQPVGIVLDGLREEGIGTIAGDDTVLVVTKTPADAQSFRQGLLQLLK
ncbi:MAG: ArgR family transcriptional regulator [Deltaproteobacteria bacterium]|nr:ArgR family transcriptional regulator [Deltaproteobacteria bacterium]